jgi:hypothetical protein
MANQVISNTPFGPDHWFYIAYFLWLQAPLSALAILFLLS